jgi:pimeloyl-ACP methyl ester carboxylesterase
MSRRSWIVLLPFLVVPLAGPSPCPSGGPHVVQRYLTVRGVVEPHTPGSGAPEEVAASENVQSIVGAHPDLNRVSYVRTFLDVPNAPAPRTILIFVPGFLGGGGTFSPLAKQLVAKFNGSLEVWAVDRRPNQLEDRRGSQYAQAQIATASNADEVRDAIYAAASFYLPEDDFNDTNENGVVDPQFELPDALGNSRGYVRLAQDDVRFMADWGVDTYVRDWKTLVDQARSVVGPQGLVLFGGHSMGTYWATVFAAYDFDPSPAVVDAGYSHIDGIVLLEGGGGRGPSATAPDFATYQSRVAGLEAPGGPDVFLGSFSGIEPSLLGPSAEIAGLAAIHLPDESAIVQRTSIFSSGPLALFFSFAPFDNRAIIAGFIDDDTEPVTAFRASVGFSDNGPNQFAPAGGGFGEFYVLQPTTGGDLRRWKDFDDPTLPTCPPHAVNENAIHGTGCAISNNGPRPAPNATPKTWGNEREVSSLDDLVAIQTAPSNFVEWYFGSGRPNLDGSYGIDSSALVAGAVAATGNEGPLVLTQNANVNVPVLCIGGSNGLAPLESSFTPYLGSIATPPADEQISLIEGYAHLDLLTAKKNDAVPILTDWITKLAVRKLLGP